MKTLFKIGEIADLFHLNVKTLRYYDEIDLVTAMVLASTYGSACAFRQESCYAGREVSTD